MNYEESTGEEWKGEDHPDNIREEFFENLAEKLNRLKDFINNPPSLDDPAPKDHYVLDGEIVRPAKTYGEYLKCFKGNNRRIALDEFSEDTFVSTVFLGIDHSFGHGTPILFETMAWLNGNDYMQNRYPTYEAAMTGHRETVEELKIALANDL